MGGFVQMPLLAMVGMGIAMAVSSSIRWLNGHNQNQEVDMDDDSRISQLPDDILGDIVSRLPDTEALRTSSLSRRWMKIWTMNLAIEFWCNSMCLSIWMDRYKLGVHNKYHTFNYKRRFFKAVDQRLKLYSCYQKKLKTFLMRSCFIKDCCTSSHLKQWIQTLDRLGVETIVLGTLDCCSSTRSDRMFTFSFNLISQISTLSSLSLGSCYIDPPQHIGGGGACQQIFNSLLDLDLSNVPLLRGEISYLLLSCPNLECLEMFECELPSSLNISGPNLKLKTLKIIACQKLSELNICALNLVELCICEFAVDLLLSSVPKLQQIYFETDGKHIQPYPFVGVPSYLPQLNCLCIHTHNYEMPLITRSFNMFSNLRKLYIVMNSVMMLDLGNITPVFTFCPLLEAFYVAVQSRLMHTKEKRGEWPPVRHNHLEHMELSGFSKTQHEFEFVRFILRSSQVLRSLVLKSSMRHTRTCNISSNFADGGWGEENDTPEDQSICHHLQAHAVSIHAKVKMCL